MAGSKRDKELARMRAERQAARRAAEARRTKQRNTLLVSALAVVLLIAGGLVLLTQLGGSSSSANALGGATPTPTPAPTPATSATPSAAPGTCTYTKTTDAPAKKVPALPPQTGVESSPNFTATIVTNRGTIDANLLAQQAPCAVNNMRSLAHFMYYDNTPCHRLVTTGLFVLQCGDPTGTGRGGPGYTFGDEVTPGTKYPRGTLAMANSGPGGTNGSQFFLVYKDTELPPNYTVFGKITKGLDVLDTIAAAGTKEPGGDGAPKLPVQIQTLRTGQNKT